VIAVLGEIFTEDFGDRVPIGGYSVGVATFTGAILSTSL
jgi:hypothetical protein